MASQEFTIRRLTAEDAEEFSALRLQALEREPYAFSSSPEEHRMLSTEEVSRRLGGTVDGANFVLGAFIGKRMVGVAGFYQEQGPKTRHKGHVWGVYVEQHSRRKGIARKMMAGIIESVRWRPELEQIYLGVAEPQKAARELYRSLGFEAYGREPNAIKVGDSYVDEDLMILRLR